jgi:hypothetical protein
MTPVSAAMAPTRLRVGLLHSAISAALLEATALVRLHVGQQRDRTYGPDVYSLEAPFLTPEWPRS